MKIPMWKYKQPRGKNEHIENQSEMYRPVK